MQKFQSEVQFNCPKCGEMVRADVDVPEPDWSHVERSSDVVGDGQTSIECSKCYTVLEATVEFDASQCRITLDDHPETRVIAQPAFFSPPDEDWADIPSSPYDHFLDAHYHLAHLLAQVNDQGGEIHIPVATQAILNRMVFTQQIGALEAFLGDTMKNGVLGSSDSTQKLLEGDLDLKKTAIPLAAIAKNPMIVRDSVAKHLSGLIYHNLAKVEKLYQLAFGISIWPNDDVKTKMFLAVKERHDCVHRNGKDKDGNSLTQITREYVTDIQASALAMAIHIEGGLGRDRSADLSLGADPSPF